MLYIVFQTSGKKDLFTFKYFPEHLNPSLTS